MKLLRYRINFANIKAPLADYLNNHEKFKFINNKRYFSTPDKEVEVKQSIVSEGDRKETSLNLEKEKEDCCCYNTNTNDRITIRQFTKKYIENPQTRFDIERNSNNVLFGKISPII
jgi:hypothetical protein